MTKPKAYDKDWCQNCKRPIMFITHRHANYGRHHVNHPDYWMHPHNDSYFCAVDRYAKPGGVAPPPMADWEEAPIIGEDNR